MVHQALILEPLDFVALMLKASLLDTLGENSGEAWSNALARRPGGRLPAPLAAAVAAGTKRRDSWLAERESRMKRNMATTEEQASEEERSGSRASATTSCAVHAPYHSHPTDFHFPELHEREFHPRRLFPWLEQVEAATAEISAELESGNGV